MREVKFRGFSKELGKWIYGFFVKREDGCFIVVTDVIWLQENNYKGLEKYIKVESESIGQFTGLKDKNGKEIYEGDILALKTYNDVVFGFVVFNYGAFCLSSRETYYDDELISNLGVEFETIGNIFENPELLESEK